MPYEEHRHFIPPTPDTVLWKYMGVDYFISLLLTEELYLTRLDKFHQDPSEGMVPERQLQPDFKFTFHNPTNDTYQIGTIEEVLGKEHVNAFLRGQHATVEAARKTIFANCWTMLEHDSDQFWKAYTNDCGVAIQTTVEDLISSLQEEPKKLFISPIKYIDFNKDTIPMNNGYFPAIHKKIRYRDDRELRIFHSCAESFKGHYKDHHKAKVNTKALITSIMIGPQCNTAAISNIKYILNLKGLSPKIQETAR